MSGVYVAVTHITDFFFFLELSINIDTIVHLTPDLLYKWQNLTSRQILKYTKVTRKMVPITG